MDTSNPLKTTRPSIQFLLSPSPQTVEVESMAYSAEAQEMGVISKDPVNTNNTFQQHPRRFSKESSSSLRSKEEKKRAHQQPPIHAIVVEEEGEDVSNINHFPSTRNQEQHNHHTTTTTIHINHHRTSTVDNVWIVPYIPAIREMVPWIVRGPLIPHTMWGPMAHRTMYCIVTKYRPDVAARVLSHNVVRIFVVGMLAAISPSTEEGCHAVQAALTAVCFAHALLVIVSHAYRVPALTALQGLQSVLLGLVACTPFMGGNTSSITALLAYIMIALMLAESIVSVIVFVIELVLQRRTQYLLEDNL